MDTHTLSYLAGAIDSDGCISIRKSNYHRRIRGDGVNDMYSERVTLKQVTIDIPQLLKESFGGTFRHAKASTENSKPLYVYESSDKQAANACRLLLPYLRVKRRQAELVLELRESKNSKYWRAAYWFEKEFPDWRTMELVTRREAIQMMGHTHVDSITQAIRHGTLIALPYDHTGVETPRIPKLLIERVRSQISKDGRMRLHPPQLIKWRERLYQEVRELNKIGINGTEIYFRSGYHTPKL